jgi:hypothetical protein
MNEMTERSAKIQIAAVLGVFMVLFLINQMRPAADSGKNTEPLPDPKVLFTSDLKTLKGFEDCTFSTVLVFTDQTMGPVMNVIRCPGTPVVSVDSHQKEHGFVAITNQD